MDVWYIYSTPDKLHERDLHSYFKKNINLWPFSIKKIKNSKNQVCRDDDFNHDVILPYYKDIIFPPNSVVLILENHNWNKIISTQINIKKLKSMIKYLNKKEVNVFHIVYNSPKLSLSIDRYFAHFEASTLDFHILNVLLEHITSIHKSYFLQTLKLLC